MDAYLKERQDNTDISGSAHFTAAATTIPTLATGKTGWTIYVQRVIVKINTSAAQTLTVEDATTGRDILKTDSAPGAGARYDEDFGPKGIPITAGESLAAILSGAGLEGHIEWYGYMKQTGVEYVGKRGDGLTGQQFQ